MKKHVLCISAGGEQIYAIRQAQKMGYTVVACDGDAAAPGLAVADIAVCVDIRQPGAVLERVRHYHPEFCIPVPIGRLLTTIGAVNDHLGLPGISLEAAENCTDKIRCNRLLSRAGVPQPEQRVAHDARTIREALPGFPCIIKPACGSGSRGVRCLDGGDTEKRIQEHLAELLDGEQSLLEEFLSGEEFGVDGYVCDGKVTVVLVRGKKISPLPYRQEIEYSAPACFSENQLSRLAELLQQAVTVLKLDSCLLNADLLFSHENFYIIEIAGRPSGLLNSTLLLPFVTGENLYETGMKILEGARPEERFLTKRSAVVSFFPMTGQVMRINEQGIDSVKGIVSKYMPFQEGDVLPEITGGKEISARGYLMAEGGNIEEARKAVAAALSFIRVR